MACHIEKWSFCRCSQAQQLVLSIGVNGEKVQSENIPFRFLPIEQLAMEANNSNQWNRASSIVVIRIVMLPEPDTSLQCLSVSQVVCFCYLFIFLISASQLIGNIPSIGFKHLNHVCNSVHLVGFAVFKKVTALDQLPFSLLRLKFFSFFLFRFTSRFLMYDFVCSKMIL